ncbi:helix-turn-helix domain-containing protein [Nocardia sp. NPDC058519]|uniref:helix-turn-helix domain-containing protein n=1 Tax=Nocardia sp. NPDC058519 TaxID=3346535 RepID=UPI003665EEB9
MLEQSYDCAHTREVTILGEACDKLDQPKDRRRKLRVAHAITIQAHREATDLTQRQLAKLTDIPLSILRNIEQGNRPVTAPEMDSIAHALGIEPEVLTIEGRQLIARGEIPDRAQRAADVWRTALGD